MLEKIKIENYKSIKDCSIELGLFNVFIGENGCGKSNILEAIAMISLGKFNDEITTEELYNKGVRVSNPKLTLNSFKKGKINHLINFQIKSSNDIETSLTLKINDLNDIFSNWNVSYNKNFDDEYKKRNENIINHILKSGGSDKLNDKEKSVFIDNILVNIHEIYKGSSDTFTKFFSEFKDYLIYNIETKALRGIIKESMKQPLGINGEGVDVLISTFDKKEFSQLLDYSKFISWLDNILIDNEDKFKHQGHKLGKSTSILYFKDKFMNSKNNIFSAENANEGILHILFYLALFISKKTPKFFAIDNIEKSLNPKLCRDLIKELAKISKENEKQVLITTHNPAILDGLNLNADEQRLFVVSRTDEGYTKVERIKIKPNINDGKYKLSELWMRGYLGGVPNNF